MLMFYYDILRINVKKKGFWGRTSPELGFVQIAYFSA
jgi:hypothetical protein